MQESVYRQLWPGHVHRLLLPSGLRAVPFGGDTGGPWALVTTYLNGRQQDEGRNTGKTERLLGLLFTQALWGAQDRGGVKDPRTYDRRPALGGTLLGRAAFLLQFAVYGV